MKALYLLLVLSIFQIPSFAQTTWNGSNWSNDLPDNLTDAIIDGNYITSVNGVFTAKNLDVTTNGSLTISENTTITVQTDVTNLGVFVIEDKASLLMIDDSGIATGSFVVKRNTPDYPTSDINSFYSSPLIEADSNMAPIFNTNDIVYFWDTTNSPTYWVGPLNVATTNFALGKGYAARPDNTSGIITRTYTGQINTGDVTVPVDYSDSTTSPGQFGYNIIGNPYPSAIDWFAFKEDNASLLSGTMYYWRQLEGTSTNYASDYVALNYLGVVPYNAATEFIGTAQGFVAKTNATGNVVFKNSQRVANSNGQFFGNSTTSNSQSRMQTDNNSWFNLTGTNETSTILIGFNPNATLAFDNDYDGIFIGGTDPLQLYSLVGAEKLLINGQPELLTPNDVAIPLGIVTTTAGNYTISIDQEFIDANYLIKLEDTQTNTITDLRLTDYTFSVTTPGENNSRFIMHYEYDSTLSITDESLEQSDFRVFFKNNKLHFLINESESPELIEVYNVTGKSIFKGNYKAVIELPNLSSGTYIVKAIFEDSKGLSKLIVKN